MRVSVRERESAKEGFDGDLWYTDSIFRCMLGKLPNSSVFPFPQPVIAVSDAEYGCEEKMNLTPGIVPGTQKVLHSINCLCYCCLHYHVIIIQSSHGGSLNYLL